MKKYHIFFHIIFISLSFIELDMLVIFLLLLLGVAISKYIKCSSMPMSHPLSLQVTGISPLSPNSFMITDEANVYNYTIGLNSDPTPLFVEGLDEGRPIVGIVHWNAQKKYIIASISFPNSLLIINDINDQLTVNQSIPLMDTISEPTSACALSSNEHKLRILIGKNRMVYMSVLETSSDTERVSFNSSRIPRLIIKVDDLDFRLSSIATICNNKIDCYVIVAGTTLVESKLLVYKYTESDIVTAPVDSIVIPYVVSGMVAGRLCSGRPCLLVTRSLFVPSDMKDYTGAFCQYCISFQNKSAHIFSCNSSITKFIVPILLIGIIIKASIEIWILFSKKEESRLNM